MAALRPESLSPTQRLVRIGFVSAALATALGACGSPDVGVDARGESQEPGVVTTVATEPVGGGTSTVPSGGSPFTAPPGHEITHADPRPAGHVEGTVETWRATREGEISGSIASQITVSYIRTTDASMLSLSDAIASADEPSAIDVVSQRYKEGTVSVTEVGGRRVAVVASNSVIPGELIEKPDIHIDLYLVPTTDGIVQVIDRGAGADAAAGVITSLTLEALR